MDGWVGGWNGMDGRGESGKGGRQAGRQTLAIPMRKSDDGDELRN